MLEEIYGVWANQDAELIITSKIILFFEVNGEEYLSFLRNYTCFEDEFIVQNKAVACFNKSDNKAICLFKKSDGGQKTWGDDYNFTYDLSETKYKIEENEIHIIFKNENEDFLVFNKKNNKIDIVSHCGQQKELEKIEAISIDGYQEYPIANENNIGFCLIKWGLGASFTEMDNDRFVAAIETNHHSYVFQLNKHNDMEFLYCRAARVRACNQGMVFAQNIRLMKNPYEFTANMMLNNLEISKADLEINTDLFDAQKCVFVNNGNEIYWSLKKFESEKIILNGCGGEEYPFFRPNNEEKEKEYFKYEESLDEVI